MKYAQFKRVKEGDLVERYDRPFYVYKKEDLGITTFDNVYISYIDEGNSNLKFVKSTDGGQTWYPSNIKIVDIDRYV